MNVAYLVTWSEEWNSTQDQNHTHVKSWNRPDFDIDFEESDIAYTQLHNKYNKANTNTRLGRYYRIWNDTLACPFEEVFTWNEEGNCIRDNLNFNRPIEILGYFLLFIVVVFSNICGVGGGYLTVIILYEIFGFESRKTYGYAAFF